MPTDEPTVEEARAILKEKLLLYRKDCLLFVREVIHAKPTWQQMPVLRAISNPGSHISIRSGHGTGKTTMLAWIILWYLSCFEDVRIPCTAPSAPQLEKNLWGELTKWHSKMATIFAREIIITNDMAYISGAQKTRFAVARTARPERPEALQGFHATNLLFIIEEASGVHDKIFEVVGGALTTPGARSIMAGNPTRAEGFFYNSFHSDRKYWTTFRFNAEESPCVTPESIARHARYGKDSNLYRVRVLGEFPKQSDDTLIPLDWVESALVRDIKPHGQKIAALDVARYGDDTNGFLIRHGQVVTDLEEWRDRDTMYTAGRIAKAYKDKRFDRIYVDVIGVGAGVVDRLKELGVPVGPVNVAETTAYDEECYLMRDELWWNAHHWFQDKRGAISTKLDRELVDQLTGELTSIRYGFRGSKIKVESKDELKKRGLPSPNLGDALCLTFAKVPLELKSSSGRRVVEATDYTW